MAVIKVPRQRKQPTTTTNNNSGKKGKKINKSKGRGHYIFEKVIEAGNKIETIE